MKRGHRGGSLGGRQELSPQRRRRRKNAREREERKWAARSGPVTTKNAVPVESRQASTGTAHEAPTNSEELVMHEPTNSNSTPPRDFYTVPGDDPANPAVYVGSWVLQHGLDLALEWTVERGLEIRDGDGETVTALDLDALIYRLHSLIGAFNDAKAELDQRGGEGK